MTYRLLGNYKYQNLEPISIETEIKGINFDNSYIKLTEDGLLTVNKGYSWDGPSGPTHDTKTFMRGSLFHDALYQLMREGIISRSKRDYADRLLQKICLEDGMMKFRAWYVYVSLKWFGAKNAEPIEKMNKIYKL